MKCNDFVSIDLFAMILPLFKSPHWDESNYVCFIKIQLLDNEIVNIEFLYYLLIIKIRWYYIILADFDNLALIMGIYVKYLVEFAKKIAQ